MNLPPYPSDDWGRTRCGVVVFVVVALLFGQRQERRVVVHDRRPAAKRMTAKPEPVPVAPDRPWVGCCKTPLEL